MTDGFPAHVKWNLSDCSLALRFDLVTHHQRLNCVDVIISTRTASAAARTPVDCSELHQQPVDAVFRPTFVQNFVINSRVLQPFTFIQTFDQYFVSFLLKSVKAAAFACTVSCVKNEKLIKMQTYMKTETCKLYSKVFWIFLPNIIKIDPCSFELYRFKVGSFLDTV